MTHDGIIGPEFKELRRYESDGRVLAVLGAPGRLMIVQEDDPANQSVVLTTEEARWLYWEALGGRANDEEASRQAAIGRKRSREAGFQAGVNFARKQDAIWEED